MRLINRDALIERMATVYTDTDQRAHYTEIMRAIMEQPTVDAVPVVRCKECKWWNTEWKHENGECYCYKIDQWTAPRFYCASGERGGKDATD